MNKFLSVFILMGVLLVSCKKDHSNRIMPGSETLHKVSFSVGFSIEAGGFVTNGVKKLNTLNTVLDPSFTTNPQITTLIYSVYDSNGNGVHVITQNKATDPGFGSYTDNLGSGVYTVVVAAGKTGLALRPNSGTASKLSVDEIRTPGDVGDILFKKFTLNVSDSDVNQNVALDRITAEMVINITDALPANAASINVASISAYLKYVVVSASGGTSSLINSYNNVPLTAHGTKNFQISVFFIPVSGSFQLHLWCSANPASSPGGNVVAEKYITATAMPNKKTILTGKLFGGAGLLTGGFNTTIDTTWTQGTMGF
jgi:hypothetical protein